MDFDQIIDRRSTESFKWKRYGADVLPMWLADMDFRSPEPVIEALHKRVAHGVFGYGGAPDGLRAAIQSHLSNRHSWDVADTDIGFISGVVTGFTHAIYSLTEPGDRILIQTPAYPPFMGAPKESGRKLVVNELVQQGEGKYVIDFNDFEEKAASGVKLFILCNPQNPTGRVFTKEELTKIAEICLRYSIVICSDEIHADLVFSDNQHISIASLAPEVSQKTVTYFAPSKTFNLAGLSTSVYVTQNAEMREILSHSMRMLLGHPNILGLHAAMAAYQFGGGWLDQVLVYLEGNRDYLADFVSSELPGVRMWTPEGTYLGWLDCRELDLGMSPQSFFLNKAKVGLNDGGDFGKAGEGFLRLNFGCPRVMLQQGLTQMKLALTEGW